MRSAQSSLSVDVQADEDDPETVRVRLRGELDITSSPLLQAVVEQVCQARREPLCRRLVVDMSGVGFADASGLSPLLHGRAMLSRRGGHVELRHWTVSDEARLGSIHNRVTRPAAIAHVNVRRPQHELPQRQPTVVRGRD